MPRKDESEGVRTSERGGLWLIIYGNIGRAGIHDEGMQWIIAG